MQKHIHKPKNAEVRYNVASATTKHFYREVEMLTTRLALSEKDLSRCKGKLREVLQRTVDELNTELDIAVRNHDNSKRELYEARRAYLRNIK